MFLTLRTSVPGSRMPGGLWRDPGDTQLGLEPLGISREAMKACGYDIWKHFRVTCFFVCIWGRKFLKSTPFLDLTRC